MRKRILSREKRSQHEESELVVTKVGLVRPLVQVIPVVTAVEEKTTVVWHPEVVRDWGLAAQA